MVAELVQLTGKPRGADGEIEQTGAAVWRVRGERLQSFEFHIDRERALRSAGIEA